MNLSRIIRAAGCAGVPRVVACGAAKVVRKVARDSLDDDADLDGVELEVHRSLPPVLARLRGEGYAIVGLEQATGAESLYTFQFPRRSVLVIGNERLGIAEDILALVDHVVEIPVYGRPHAHNAATAAAIAIYEYCRQYPEG